ncbi:MAG TPA: hypothetical protein VLK83_06795, partial [Rhodanobacteraceae bacterium]|nr:hypothetical protein [Rhodanobacteraceae bacterium]
MRLGRSAPVFHMGALLLALGFAQAFAADRPFLLQAGDKTEGEDEAIEQRIEWFERARGLDEQADARSRRAAAVSVLRRQIATRVPALLAQESWQPLGPDGMTMLNWDMGRV